MSNPCYPVYIISKGRAESRLTSRSLEQIGVPYHIVVEPQEYEQYAKVIDPKKILVTPFSNLGQGSIPVRNFVWEHAIATGAKRHWIMDDNLRMFFRFNHNLKVPVTSGTIFKCAEDFVDRYENVAISGLQYFMFIPRKSKIPPYTLNTRIYSCILIQNDIPYRWRGRYNEDTDLSIRALKDGWCTVLFTAFFCDKMTTLTMKGGNTDELYKDDGRLRMAQSLVDQHPDIVTITEKWGRAQHQVNYDGFKRNKLKFRPGVVIPEGVNNYGMKMVILEKSMPIMVDSGSAESEDEEQAEESVAPEQIAPVATQSVPTTKSKSMLKPTGEMDNKWVDYWKNRRLHRDSRADMQNKSE